VTWDQLAAEIAQAIGKNPDEIPRLGTPEFNQLFGVLLDSNPDLATRVQVWLVQSTERVPSQSQIAAEARKSEARRRLASLFTKPDHTQPHRRRINKPVILAAIGAAMAILWVVGRLHSSPMSVPETRRMPPRAVTASTRPVSPPAHKLPPLNAPPRETRRPASAATAGIGIQSRAPFDGLPTPPPPPLPPGPTQALSPTQLFPAGTSGAGLPTTPVQTGAQVIAASASQAAGITVVAGTAASGSLTGPTAPTAGTVVVGADHGPSEASAVPPAPPQASEPGGASAAPRFQIGDQFTVSLLTPIAVSPVWQSLPAVAQAEDGPISGWQLVGSASQGQDGSLQIAWTQAISPDRKTTITLHGVAYDPKVGKPGVPGATSSVMAGQRPYRHDHEPSPTLLADFGQPTGDWVSTDAGPGGRDDLGDSGRGRDSRRRVHYEHRFVERERLRLPRATARHRYDVLHARRSLNCGPEREAPL
jgi:hypothetical protein